MFDNIRGVIRFCASGTKLYPFINAVKDEGIICKNQRCYGNKFYGSVYHSDMKYIEDIAEDYDISITVTNRNGLVYKAAAYRRRYGFIAGMIIVPLFIVFISSRAVIIEINGNERNSDKQVIDLLEDAGIKKGASLRNVDFGYVEQYLRLNLDSVVWTAVRHTGCRVVIDIDESDEIPEILKERTPANIISSKNAQIVSVNVQMGQLERLINEGIKKGDILISGVYADDKGNIRCVHALGSVIGVYDESIIFSQPFSNSERVKTGKTVEQKYLESFGFRIPMFIKKNLPDDYEYSEKTEIIEFMDKKLPFGIVDTKYTEYTTEDVVYTQEQAEDILNEKIKRYEKNFLSDCEIMEKNIEKIVLEDRIDYIVKYKLKGEIGKTEEILINK